MSKFLRRMRDLPFGFKAGIAVFVMVSLFFLLGLGSFGGKNSAAEIVPVKRGDVVEVVYATGIVEPVYSARLGAEVAGQVVEVPVEEGQEVRAGQVLLQLNDQVEQQQLASISAQLQFLEQEVARLQALRSKEYTSKALYDRTISEYQQAKAQEQAQLRILDRMRLVAPVDGVILRRDIEPGEIVKAGETVLWLGDPQQLRISADVDEEDILKISLGQRVLIASDAFPDRHFDGVVDSVTPRGDMANKSFRVRIKLAEKSALPVLMSVEVNIVVREAKQVLLVPTAAVKNSQVWRVDGKNGKISAVQVSTGAENAEKIEIVSGLLEGDEILRNAPKIQEKR